LKKAVAGVRVGYLPGQGFVVNPTASQMAASQLDLMMAGTAEAVLMIEGFCDWMSEEQMLEVMGLLCWQLSQHDCTAVCPMIREWVAGGGSRVRTQPETQMGRELQERRAQRR
jgi:polyribonucleotide nucleotidyltransferase